MDLVYTILDNKFSNIKEIVKSEFHISDRLLRKLKQNSKIHLNNSPISVNYNNIHTGDIISVDLNFDEEYDNILPTKMPLDILYEDNYLLVVNKEPNTPVHPSCNHFSDSLSNGVKFYYDSIRLKRKIRIVNRLDKDTSGIVIFAKNEYVQESLIKQMQTHIFKKEYLAVLDGTLDSNNGVILAPIARKENSIIERCVNFDTGDIAITHYDLIKTIDESCSLVHFVLETGRTHQIRVHSKYIGYPILGDTLYGQSSKLIDRQALHAYKVSFIHPITKEEIQIEAELPEDMRILF